MTALTTTIALIPLATAFSSDPGVSTLEGANRVFSDYLPRFNQRFGIAPPEPTSAFDTDLPPNRTEPLLPV